MSHTTLSPKDQETLDSLFKQVQSTTAFFMGYPVSKEFDFAELAPFLGYPMNNLGDPFVSSTYAVGSREMEKEVVAFFASLFRAEANDWWGYVTNGGSEGHL